MAEQPEKQGQEEPQSVATLTTKIVVAYVRNTVAPTDLGDLIGAVARTLGALGRVQPEPVKPEPAVPVRRSIRTMTTSSAWSAASSRRRSNAISLCATS